MPGRDRTGLHHAPRCRTGRSAERDWRVRPDAARSEPGRRPIAEPTAEPAAGSRRGSRAGRHMRHRSTAAAPERLLHATGRTGRRHERRRALRRPRTAAVRPRLGGMRPASQPGESLQGATVARNFRSRAACDVGDCLFPLNNRTPFWILFSSNKHEQNVSAIWAQIRHRRGRHGAETGLVCARCGVGKGDQG